MSSNDSDWLPTPEELEHAPELAVMAALDSTLEVTACALELAHPELGTDSERPYWVAPRAIVADGILSIIDRLRDALFRYRELTLDQHQPTSLHFYDPDDLPF